jgi:hypothetical protein
MRKLVAALSACCAALALAIAPHAVAGPRAADRFGRPVKVTPANAGGYEPAVYTDRFGDIFVTAHKENWQLALGPDGRSPTRTRSMSWDWYSATDGRSWHDLPGLTPLSLENHDFGDEGDMTVDDANHLYFVDTNVTDVTFTKWTIHGRGRITFDTHRPVLPAAQPVDDRPWITAHLDGHVFYFGNEGDKVTYPFGRCSGKCGDANGPGRYTVYASYNGGRTFSNPGYTLKGSGWCRPAAAPHSRYVYAVCTNDGGSNDFSDNGPKKVGTIWAYVSADDGHTWNRYRVGSYSARDSTTSWPTVAIAPDGTVYALYVNATKLDKNDDPRGNRLLLFHSTDHGRTWSRRDITSVPGRYDYNWLSISPSGSRLGLGTYYRRNNHSPWYVEGATFAPGTTPRLISLDPMHPVAPADHMDAPGDLLGSSFSPDGAFQVVWTRDVITTQVATIFRDIYYARTP